MRDTILLHGQHLKNLDKLTDEQAGKLLKSLYALMIDENPVPMDGVTEMLFCIMRDWTLNNWTAYDNKSEARREAGRKGGLAKGSNANFAKANSSKPSNAKFATNENSKNSKAKHNDNDNENDNDNDNDCVIFPHGKYMNVFLTTDEYNSLVADMGAREADYYIDRVSSYQHESGKEYARNIIADKVREYREGDLHKQEQRITVLNTTPKPQTDLYARAEAQLKQQKQKQA